MIRGLLAALVVFLVATFPATWLLMLLVGNVGVDISYWGTLPPGDLVSVLLGSASAPTFVVRDRRQQCSRPVLEARRGPHGRQDRRRRVRSSEGQGRQLNPQVV